MNVAESLQRLTAQAPPRAVVDLLPPPDGPARTGPLSGVPFAVKNNISVAGARLTCGSRLLENYRSPYTATAVAMLEQAGAVPVCTANLDEFGMGSTGENSAFGVPVNPAAPHCCPGGSSSGPAALVAAGCVPLALASDTGGSARLPAAYCGVLGMKPSYGAFSRYGLTAYASSLEQIGLIGRDPALLRRAHACLSARPDPLDATHRGLPPAKAAFRPRGAGIALLTGCLPDVEAAVAGAAESAARALEKLGARIIPCAFPRAALLVPAYYVIACAEASANLARFTGMLTGARRAGAAWEDGFAAERARLGPEVRKRVALGAYVLREGHYQRYYLRAQGYRRLLAQWFARLFADCALLLLPPAPTAAPPLSRPPADPLFHYRGDQLTACANLAGLPALSLPWGRDEQGRPLAVQLIAPAGRDAWLLDAAELLAAAREG